MFLHAERRGTGPPLVLVHGFTQTGRCWGPEADALAADHEVVLVDAPGHGRSAEIMAGLAHRRPADRRPGRRGHLPRLLDGRAVLPARRAHQPRARPRARAARRHGRHRGPRRARAASPAGPGHRGAHRARRAGGVPRRLARPTALRRPPAGATRSEQERLREHRRGAAVEPRAGRHRRAGPVVARAPPPRHARARPRRRRRRQVRRARRAHGRGDRRQRRRSPSSRAPATPPTSSNPTASSRSSNPGSPPTTSESRVVGHVDGFVRSSCIAALGQR